MAKSTRDYTKNEKNVSENYKKLEVNNASNNNSKDDSINDNIINSNNSNNKKSKKRIISREMDFTQVISATLMIILIIGWLPSFIEIIINFVVLKSMKDLDWFLISGILWPILLIPIMTYLNQKLMNKLYYLLKKIYPILIIVTIILNLASYYSYYHIIIGDYVNIPEYASANEIIGFMADYSPFIMYMIFLCEFFSFFILIPCSYLIYTKGEVFPKFTQEGDLALILVALYLAFRFGSFIGIFFRFAIINLLFLLLWIFFNKKLLKIEIKNIQNEIKLNMIPLGAIFGIVGTIGYWFGVMGFISNGTLYDTWIWLLLGIGILIKQTFLAHNIKYQKFTLYIFSILIIIEILISWANISAILMKFQNILLFIGFFLFGLGFIGNSALFSYNLNSGEYENSIKQIYLSHPIRLFFFLLISLLGLIMPLIASVMQPFTVWIVVVLMVIFLFITLMILKKKA